MQITERYEGCLPGRHRKGQGRQMGGGLEEGELKEWVGRRGRGKGEWGIWEQVYNIGSGPTSAALHLNIFDSCQQLVK